MRILWPVYDLSAEYSQYPGIMTISALLKQNGFQVEVVPADCEQIVARVGRDESSILAYSVPTPYYQFYRELNKKVKQRIPSILAVFGGPHPTFFPEMIEHDGVDAICIGEGEYPMLELVRSLASGKLITNIQNWWVKENGEIHRNPIRPLIENLDELPIPDHEVFRRAMSSSVSQAVVITSRGCPHNCTYCYNHVYRRLYRGKGKVIRRRSVDSVIQELREIKKRNCRFIRFMDDLFILSAEWIEEFSPKYKEHIGLPFSCLVRANFVTEEIVRMLKDAGCYRMVLGVEAGNDYVRNEILKRNMSNQVILDAARLIKAAGIKLFTANIVAIPGASIDADWETLELNVQCKPDYASAAILHPFPRTEIYSFAQSEGMLDDQDLGKIESSFGFGLTSPLKFGNVREKRLAENLHKFFPLTVRFPWLAPLVRRLIELPQNRLFNAIYMLTVNLGMHLYSVPPRIGLPILWRKLKLRLGGRKPGEEAR